MNTTPRRHLFPPFVRRHRDTLLRVVATVLALAMLASGLDHHPATARADSTCSGLCLPPPLLNPGLLQSSSLYSATAAQQQSLQNLEQQAIQDTIQDHGLASSDAAAVQTWGRDDALAELFWLLVQAIQAQPISRTTDQQNAVDWLTAVVQRQNVQAADDAGLEYVQWAGLDQAQYQNLLASNASESSLQSFLTDDDPTGYCSFRSPPGAKDVYTGYNTPSCAAPCTTPATGYIPNPPSYNNFVEWGAALADYASFNTNDFSSAMKNISLDATAGVAAVTIGIRLASAGFSLALAASVADTIPAVLAGIAGILAPVGLVLFVIVAVAAAIVGSINLANAVKLPGQLATLITSAPTTTPNLGAMLADKNQMTELFSLFVGATLPTPLPGSCAPLASDNGTSSCLNAPAIPAPATSDPAFAIQARGATTTTDSTSLTWADASTGITTTARLSGLWFVDQVANPDGSTTDVTQTLRMHYTDWSGQGQTAWLYGDPTDGYKFLGIADQSTSGPPLNPSTCLADQTCAYTSTIDYVGTDGQDYSAQVIPSLPSLSPTVNPSTSANPLEGNPITFTANGSSPVGATPITYQWQFEPAPALGVSITCEFPSCPSVSGAVVSNTWTTSGTFDVQLTATDSHGRQTVDTFTVAVGDVPPTLALYPVAPLNPTGFACLCDVHTVSLGSVTALHGVITHAGSADVENVDINWGDGTPDDSGSNGPGSNPSPLALSAFSNTKLILADTHTYAAAGTYPVTVTVSDQSGATAVVTTTETVQDVTTVTWPAPAAITYGTALSSAQLDATASATITISGNTASVPGTFAYSVDGTPVTPSQVLPAGPHTLTAQFTPDDPTLYTTPDPVSVPLTVTQAPLTITASSPSLAYNGTVPAITPGYSGFVNNESAASLTTAPTCSSTAPGSGAAGTYQTSCTGAADANYSLTYLTGTLTITPAPLTITATDQTTAYGQVPSDTWTSTGWVNGESASTLATAPNSPPTCSATVAGAPESATTPPGVYPGAITCQGAVDPNYAFTYVGGQLTINPLLSLDEQGLPGSVPHQATLDGQTVSLPDSNVEVAYGSSHGYSFPTSVTDPGSGTVYFTADQGFSGAVTANISDTAVYQTMAQVVSTALAAGGVDNGGQANALTQQFAAVQADIQAGNTSQALADVQSFASHVQAQAGKHIATATAQALLADAQSVYANLGGTGPV